MFDVGQKVVCVDDVFVESLRTLYTSLPKKDSTYVVREIQIGVTLCPGGGFEGAVCVLLVGLNNPRANSRAALERGFNSDRFRSLEELRERSVGKVGQAGTATAVWNGQEYPCTVVPIEE